MKITPEIKKRLDQLAKQIKTDMKALDSDLGHLRSHADSAILSAWQIGKALIEAKTMIKHGNFMQWQEQVGVSHATAGRYIKLASNYSVVSNLPKNKRDAYLAIGLLPAKEEIQHDGNVTLAPPPMQHLQFVNRFNNWHRQVTIGKIVPDQEQLKVDLRPVYEWMKGLYGEG